MKTQIIYYSCLLLLYVTTISTNKLAAQEKIDNSGKINIASTADLYDLTSKWAGEYHRQNPDQEILVTRIPNTSLTAISEQKADVFFVSDENSEVAGNLDFQMMKVGKDVLVPILNSNNPFLAKIKKQKITPEILSELLKKPENRRWNVFPEIEKAQAIHYYLVDRQQDKSMIAKFLSTHRNIEGIVVENYEKMIAAIQNDPYSIGFCQLSTLIKSTDPHINNNITIVPVDKNQNGKIDEFENVYCDLQTFMQKAWIGKFPLSLTKDIYSVTSKKTDNQTKTDFLKWVSTEGQQYANQNGYVALVYGEKQMNLKTLGVINDYVAVSNDSSLFLKISTFLGSFSTSQYVFAGFIFLLIVVITLIAKNSKITTIARSETNPVGIFDQNSLNIPASLFFDKTHTWAFMEKEGLVRIGLDDFLQHVTGPLTKVILKNPGEVVKKGEPVLTIIQNGKQLTVNSPVSGTISAQNKYLAAYPSILNQSPYQDGWVYLIEPTSWEREIQFFTMAEKYKEWIKNEFTRLKDFLATTIQSKMPEYATVALQDGGEIKDQVMADLGPAIWEEFQVNFLDTMK